MEREREWLLVRETESGYWCQGERDEREWLWYRDSVW